MRDLSGILDSILLEMLRNEDDDAAFSELYNRYWDKLFAAAYKRVRSVEAAEEIVQDLFVDLWNRRRVLDIRSGLAVYLFSAIKYKVIHNMHKQMIKQSFEQHNPFYHEYDNSTDEVIIANDLKSHLEHSAEQLPEKCRAIYHLSRNEYQSNKAIAEQLHISEKTVENQLTKALKRLRTSLNFFFL